MPLMINKIKNSLGKNFFLKIIIPLLALIMLVKTTIGLSQIPQRKITEPMGEISNSVYQKNVVGTGITEPKSEIIEIGTDISGIVTKIYVAAGNKVKQGQKLFTIDDREAKANYDLAKTQYKIAQIQANDAKQQFSMLKKVKDKRAISKDDFERKKFALELAKQKVQEAKNQLEISRIALKKLTVHAPITGEILKINAKLGEYAVSANPSKPLMTIGDLSKMYVRVEVDETESYKVHADKEATGFLRGRPDFKIPLQFVRFEPYIVPKTNISGANNEKIDTRVLQVLYSLDNSDRNIFVGQQMDVYIEGNE